MFFVLSKTVDFLFSPLTWALLGGLEALRRVIKRRSSPLVPLVVALGVLYLFATETVAELLTQALERGATTSYDPNKDYDAVVVLGGITGYGASANPFALVQYNDNIERLLVAYEIIRTGHARTVVLSAGPPAPPGRRSEAVLLSEQLLHWGVAPDQLVVEGQSRNTRENAVESAAIVRQHGWRNVLIVTSAFHMPRAHGCFRAVGLDVDTLPVDYRAMGITRQSWMPHASSLFQSEHVLHEFFGRWVYQLRGYSKT